MSDEENTAISCWGLLPTNLDLEQGLLCLSRLVCSDFGSARRQVSEKEKVGLFSFPSGALKVLNISELDPTGVNTK